MESSPTVFVSCYGEHVTKEDLRRHFEECGAIYRIDMMENNSGRFTFVEFTDVAGGRAAVVKKDDSIFQGRRLRVRFSNKKSNTPQSSPPPIALSMPLSPPPPVESHRPRKTPNAIESLGPSDPRSHWLFSSTTPLVTPSYLAGIPIDVETQLRRTTSWYIVDLTRKLDLPHVATVTAMTYMNRFFMLHSFSSHDRYLVGSAAVFLSAKVNERTVKLTQLTEASLMLASDAPDKSSSVTPADIDHVKQRIRQYEVVLLNTLSYDVVVPQPHLALAALADEAIAQVDMARENVLNVADVFLNDAMSGTVALQLTADELAAGALYLSCLFHRMDDFVRSTDVFAHVHIKSVACQFLAMYDSHRLPGSLQAFANAANSIY
ncbi:hypothetical protein H310_13818 [Aphanomyces invadans]|uniref:RRM domain-containing protein n=1 Tax=Aphanomyces invadans TaxID=157072 RepID=A0A024TC74_9STRA|nr:hypothetical protein H310_13818 [Aphanomyces invadans]ETV91760.1 hypothetical protein H310_13818 [Aphanomyces invadans]|eukprot:XP_008879686.1 hypothetical protein H310_13818 [Aphanomyces invadans]